tara:strand:- start:215 stop:553 length:339 start_codon:yes stop_codon:yes gene_type:complete
MKRLIFVLISILLSAFVNADINDFLKNNENPNGEPFVVSIGIEKNIHSFKYYDQSTFYVTLPISAILTFKYRENVQYQEDMVVLKSEHDMIESLDKHYALELHLPIYKLWDK